jgi:hypothetical protein
MFWVLSNRRMEERVFSVRVHDKGDQMPAIVNVRHEHKTSTHTQLRKSQTAFRPIEC